MSPDQLKLRAKAAARADPRLSALASALGEHVARARLVGGTVRDWALGKEPLELDVVVEGDARDLAELLAGEDARVHHRFMTAEVDFEFGTVEFASARAESYPEPGALPEVKPAELGSDLLRRDFTVNALLLSLDGSDAGGLEEGWQDLADGVLRVLHDQSFRDDPTRLWRLARYAGRLGFSIEDCTAGLAAAAVGEGLLACVSPARIGAEFLRTTALSEPDEALECAVELGLLGPAPDPLRLRETFESARRVSGGTLPNDQIRASAAASALPGWPEFEVATLELGDRLQRCLIDGRTVGELQEALGAADRPSEIHAACSRWEPAAVACASVAGAEDEISLWFGEIRSASLPIDGDDLIAAGISEGPAVGVGLDAALDSMLDYGTDSPEELLAVAVEAARGAEKR